MTVPMAAGNATPDQSDIAIVDAVQAAAEAAAASHYGGAAMYDPMGGAVAMPGSAEDVQQPYVPAEPGGESGVT